MDNITEGNRQPNIEDQALHFFDSNKRVFTGINAGEYLDKEDFEKFAASLSKQVGGCAWVRASERLPKKDAPRSLMNVKLRFFDNERPIEKVSKYLSDGLEIEENGKLIGVYFDKVEWYDESTSPSCTEGKDKEIERKFTLKEMSDCWDDSDDRTRYDITEICDEIRVPKAKEQYFKEKFNIDITKR